MINQKLMTIWKDPIHCIFRHLGWHFKQGWIVCNKYWQNDFHPKTQNLWKKNKCTKYYLLLTKTVTYSPLFPQKSSSRAQHLGVKTTKATKLPSDPKPPYISLLIGWWTVIHSIFFTKALFCLIWLSFNAPRKNSAAYNLKPTPNGSKYFGFPLCMQGTNIWAAAQSAVRFTT